MERSVAVIVVNFNAGEALVDCVKAALASPATAMVCVADNASEDRSMDALSESLRGEPRLEIQRNKTNPGFAPAVNRAARTRDEPYLLILNPDCVLCDGALQAMVEALENDTGAALAGPWVTDSKGQVQKGTWRRLPDPWRSLMTVTGLYRLSRWMPALSGIEHPGAQRPPGPIPAEATSGACMLLRRSAAAAVGFFDEAYAMHCEDLDLMRRLQEQGGHCLLVPHARAIHAGGVSSASRPWWVHRQKHAGMQRYFRKFHAARRAAPFRWLVYTGIWGHYVLTLPLVLLRRRTPSS